MHPYVDQIMSTVQQNLRIANDSGDLGSKIVASNQAIVTALGGILVQIVKMNEALERMEKCGNV